MPDSVTRDWDMSERDRAVLQGQITDRLLHPGLPGPKNFGEKIHLLCYWLWTTNLEWNSPRMTFWIRLCCLCALNFESDDIYWNQPQHLASETRNFSSFAKELRTVFKSKNIGNPLQSLFDLFEIQCSLLGHSTGSTQINGDSMFWNRARPNWSLGYIQTDHATDHAAILFRFSMENYLIFGLNACCAACVLF